MAKKKQNGNKKKKKVGGKKRRVSAIRSLIGRSQSAAGQAEALRRQERQAAND